MSVSRRAFVRSLAPRVVPSSAAIAARGREAWAAEHPHGEETQAAPEAPLAVRLNSNENPLGPGQSALGAIERAFAYAGRYPMNARPSMADFRTLVAKRNGLKIENVALGAGSGELLECAVMAFASASRSVVSAAPTFESPARTARDAKFPLVEIPVDAEGKLDLEKMTAAASNAGLVFVCNPNNPTGAVHGADAIASMVSRIAKASPETMILIDEAYHEYVTDPGYSTAIPLVSKYPNVLVSRTLSKAHGMAGLRLGYAVGQPEAIAKLSRWTMPYNGNALVVAAGVASIEDEAQIERERRRNTEVLKFTTDFFRNNGFKTSDSQANFVWVNLRRPAQEFQQACEKQGILVGRAFPPFEKTHGRISLGTMAEMQKAVGVFKNVLGLTTTTAGGR
jgi:histidinol-phosphate aminotransferase